MKKLLILFCILYTPAYANKPLHGHPFHNMKVQNFVHKIDISPDLSIIEPGWVGILHRQSLEKGNGVLTFDKLKMVNNKINSKQAFGYAPWMTPKEFSNVEFADCKAYATTKYYELRALGWKPEQLNLWAGDYDGRAHLILVARIDDKQYVLDIMDQSLPDAKDYFYKHFVPSYRFNEIGLDVE